MENLIKKGRSLKRVITGSNLQFDNDENKKKMIYFKSSIAINNFTGEPMDLQ